MEFSLTLYQIGDERATLRIGHAREITLWFVEKDVGLFLIADLGVDKSAADFYVIRFGIGLGAELGDLPVNGNLAGLDNFFSRATRCDPGLGDELL